MESLADFIFDLAQNSITAHARNIHIYLEENTHKNLLTIIIKDDGKGIRFEDLPKVTDVFYTTREESKRRVGLGLALMNQVCNDAGGELVIDSEPGSGTTVKASMQHDHIDRPPLGDLADVFTTLLVDIPKRNLEWTLEHKYNIKRYTLTDEGLLDALNLSSFQGLEARKRVREFISTKEENIHR